MTTMLILGADWLEWFERAEFQRTLADILRLPEKDDN